MPFIMSCKWCFKDFKPGLASNFEADISLKDGRPVPSMRVKVSVQADGELMNIEQSTVLSDRYGTVSFEIKPGIQHEVLAIKLETADERYVGMQTSGTFELFKYQSNSNAYIAFNRSRIRNLKPGDNFVKLIHLEPPSIQDVYYIVISKGNILAFNKSSEGNATVRKVEFEVNYEMVPSFRIIAFAHYNNEMLADSLNIEVERVCYGDSEVTTIPDFDVKEPGRSGKIIINGTEGNLVGLLGIDEAVYVYSEKYIFNKDMVFNEISSHDLGCGPGGGVTPDAVFKNGGIILLTNHFTPSFPHTCKEKEIKRGRREAFLMKEAETFERRSGVKNISEFKRSERSISEAEVEIIEQNITIRNDFKEIWIFDDVQIEVSGTEFPTTLPSSVTTWVVQAMTVSHDHGFCLSESQKIESKKKAFLTANLPYSAIIKEQIGIPVTVFNYEDKNLTAHVYMYDDAELCEAALPGLKTERQTLIIEPFSSQSTSIPIIPMKTKNYDIKLMVITPEGSEIVQKPLQVVMDWIDKEINIEILLDPSNVLRRKESVLSTDAYTDFINTEQNLQVTTLKLIAPNDSIHGTIICYIEAIGDLNGPFVQTVVNNTETLLVEPRGYGEENIMLLATTIYTMKYLKATNKLTPANEEKGQGYISLGYRNQLTYRQEDGSYSVYDPMPSSTWLTVFVMKVFCQASNFIYVSPNVICSGIKWIIKKQRMDGSFAESFRMAELDMMGGVLSDTSMTAFVFIVLEECSCEEEKLPTSKKRALSYLEDHFAELDTSVEIAMVAYALSLGGSDMKSVANDKLLSLAIVDKEKNMLHWEKEYPGLTIETAGYALLNQILLDNMQTSTSIVNWLNTKQLQSGIYISTQDTVTALQALTEYATKSQMQTTNLVSNILSNKDPFFHKVIAIHESNAHILQEVMVNKIDDILSINTMGKGIGRLNVKLRYSIMRPNETCGFYIWVNVAEPEEQEMKFGHPRYGQERSFFDTDPDELKEMKEFLGSEIVRNDSEIRIRISICFRYMGSQIPKMSIIEVGIFLGFFPEVEDLRKLEDVRLVDGYDVSSRGVIFYLKKIPTEKNRCIQFHAIRKYLGEKIVSRAVKIYDYYNPSASCSVFYSPGSKENVLKVPCIGGGCPPQRAFENVIDKLRSRSSEEKKKYLIDLFCQNYDFVWSATYLELNSHDEYYNLTFRVLEVFKEGVEKKTNVEGQERHFLLRMCNLPLITREGYLILGKDKQQYTNNSTQVGYRYLLDENSILFWWNFRIGWFYINLLTEVIDGLKDAGCPSLS